MLVISRNMGTSIKIGDDITVTILGLNSSHQVRVGIEAPKNVSIQRDDIIHNKPKKS